MLSGTYYAKKYASIIGLDLEKKQLKKIAQTGGLGSSHSQATGIATLISKSVFVN